MLIYSFHPELIWMRWDKQLAVSTSRRNPVEISPAGGVSRNFRNACRNGKVSVSKSIRTNHKAAKMLHRLCPRSFYDSDGAGFLSLKSK